MSGAVARAWSACCERLGVQPRQFAVLVGTAMLAIGALVARPAFQSVKRSATQDATPAVAEEVPAPAAHARPAAVLRCTLEERPARDPFRTFVQPTGIVAGDAGPGMPLAAAPAGLVLRAVIAGELAAIGEHTVGIGGAVADAQGSEWTVVSIGERAVILSDGARRA